MQSSASGTKPSGILSRVWPDHKWLLFLAGLMALRVIYACILRVNTDEPQHLHVVWAWSQMQLPFRDVFDNHAQLFQLLNAPLLSLLGESANIVVYMRLALLPWYLLLLWCTYRIGTELYSRPVGLWAALLCGIFPRFFVLTSEFRPDNAWAAVWLLMLATAVSGKPSHRRNFFVGMLAGVAFIISVKTLLLAGTLILALLGLALLPMWRRNRNNEWRNSVVPAASGLTIAPGLFLLFFTLEGSLQEMWYGLVEHNLVPGLGRWQNSLMDALIFPILLIPLLWTANRIWRGSGDVKLGFKRALIFLAASFYLTCLWSYWPLFTKQDLLPFFPLVFIYGTAWMFGATSFLNRGSSPGKYRQVIPALLLASEAASLMASYPPWENMQQNYANQLGLLLKMTDSKDSVMDAKGETVFRNRPFFYALETITLKRMELGLIADDIPQRLETAGTPVVVLSRLSEKTSAFVQANYLPISPKVFVAGQWLPETGADGIRKFEIRIPVRYRIIDAQGQVYGILDGKPYSASDPISVGHHTFDSGSDGRRIAIVWEQAYMRGYSPFSQESVARPTDTDLGFVQ